MLSCLIIEESCQPLVVGVGFGLPIVQQKAHLVLQLVEVDGLFEQDGTAHHEQIIEQGGGQVLGKVLRFV